MHLQLDSLKTHVFGLALASSLALMVTQVPAASAETQSAVSVGANQISSNSPAMPFPLKLVIPCMNANPQIVASWLLSGNTLTINGQCFTWGGNVHVELKTTANIPWYRKDTQPAETSWVEIASGPFGSFSTWADVDQDGALQPWPCTDVTNPHLNVIARDEHTGFLASHRVC
jgi:hypothetical protein